MPKRQVVDHVQTGEVLLVEKEALPQKAIELSHRQAEKLLRPKAPRTEAQIANTKRLVELNRQRANEWKEKKGLIVQSPNEEKEIPAEVAADKVPIRIKPKNKYERKLPAWNSPDTLEMLEKKAAEVAPKEPSALPRAPHAPARVKAPPKPKTKPQPVTPPSYYESESEEEEDEPQPLPPPKRKAPVRRKIVQSDTSETETTDTETEMTRVQKYVRKAAARMDAVKQIDERLKQVSNKYAAAGLSVF
jgi:hypothetical protein